MTGDPIGRVLKKTAFNPAFTLGLLLLARYTKKGSDFSILHETAFKRVKTLFYLGLARWASGFFDEGVKNNWTKDTYEWDKEIVLITGGAGGIGGNVVKLLAERGIKVVVLDVIPMTFDTRMFFRICLLISMLITCILKLPMSTITSAISLHHQLLHPLQRKSVKMLASPQSSSTTQVSLEERVSWTQRRKTFDLLST